MSLQERLRKAGPTEYLRIYTRTVIPQIESRIEERLLAQFIRDIPNQMEKKEIFDAYQMRRHNLTHVKEEGDQFTGIDGEKDRSRDVVDEKELEEIVSTMQGDGLSFHTYQDIGKYTVFPQNHYKRMFPSKAFGRIEEMEYEKTKTFGIMCREEGLRLTNEMARLTLPKDRSIDYLEIGTTFGNV